MDIIFTLVSALSDETKIEDLLNYFNLCLILEIYSFFVGFGMKLISKCVIHKPTISINYKFSLKKIQYFLAHLTKGNVSLNCHHLASVVRCLSSVVR
jgi:hypothetical protein